MSNKNIFLATFITFLWALNFIVIKIGLESFPPLLFSALRFILCAIPLVFFVNRKMMSFKTIIWVGFFLGFVKFGLLFVGMHLGMTAALSSIVLQAQTFFTAILAYFILKQSLSLTKIIGMIIAFLGILGMFIERLNSTEIGFYSFSLIVIAGLAWAISNIIINKSKEVEPLSLIVWMSLIPPIPLLILSYFFETNQVNTLLNIGIKEIMVLVYTSGISTLFGFAIWSRLIKENGASQIAPFSLLVPVFGVILSYIYGESLTLIEIISSLIMFIGLIVFVLGERIFKKNSLL